MTIMSKTQTANIWQSSQAARDRAGPMSAAMLTGSVALYHSLSSDSSRYRRRRCQSVPGIGLPCGVVGGLGHQSMVPAWCEKDSATPSTS